MRTDRRRWIVAVLTTVIIVLAVGVEVALASHSDGGIDEPWVEAMNQESYWESRFGGECTKYENHSGFIPASYEAAVVKDGNYVRVYNPAPDDMVVSGPVNPANGQHFAAPHSWVMKCDTTTTTTPTTQPSTTTTTSPTTTTTPTTSTTLPAPTTTVPTESTTTTSGRTSVGWSASATCEVLVAEWGEGIVRVDLYQRLPEDDFGPADGITPFTVSGQEISTVGAFADSEWILVPVVTTGYVAVPDQISLFTEHCTPSSVSRTPDSPETLPFTGPFENVTLLGFSAVALIVLGWMMVREARR